MNLKRTILGCLLCLVIQTASSQNNDSSAYNYRGMHLDVSRHFFSKEIIKKYLDTLAQYHINYFHWHLTDDQGWRIEIKQYPRLTEVGAWRVEKDGSTYGGFYSQADVREVVKYAQERNITIIPEIEMPGHSSAAIAAYPWLGCTNLAVIVPNHWGVFRDIYKPSDSTFQFLKNVLDEVCELFPSHYIHIGGDEVPKAQWKQSPEVAQLMKEKKMKNYEQLQHYFMKQLEDYLLKKGRRVIMWGEAVRGGIGDSTIIMSWRGKAAGIKAAKKGNEVIMAPRFTCYFDYPQSLQDRKAAWWMTYSSYRKVAGFNPQSTLLSKNQNQKIIGAEATLWTEYVTDEAQIWHQIMPRLKAFSNALK